MEIKKFENQFKDETNMTEEKIKEKTIKDKIKQEIQENPDRAIENLYKQTLSNQIESSINDNDELWQQHLSQLTYEMQPKKNKIFQNNLRIPTLIVQNIKSPTPEKPPYRAYKKDNKKNVAKIDLQKKYDEVMLDGLPLGEDNIS